MILYSLVHLGVIWHSVKCINIIQLTSKTYLFKAAIK